MKSYRSHRIVTETDVVDGWLTVDEAGSIIAVETSLRVSRWWTISRIGCSPV